VNVKWRKPVAMLINGGTRSGKEVLAYGFKKYRLGELIGTRTEGAVLAATAFLIGSGLLLLAVEDVRVDGERLEGVGVTPTIEVQAGPASGGTDDPQLSLQSRCCPGHDPGAILIRKAEVTRNRYWKRASREWAPLKHLPRQEKSTARHRTIRSSKTRSNWIFRDILALPSI
jgi:hypothetical protein